MDVREKLVELLTDDYCPLLYMQGDVGNFADYLIKRGVTVQEWISVTERLPQEDKRVLVWVGENDRYFPVIDTDRLHKGRWVRWDKYITHWMPLPEPPKGE